MSAKASTPTANKLFDLNGRTALITGSSQGLGFAIARGLAQAGAAVVLNGREKKKLTAAAEMLRGEGAKVTTAHFDVTEGAATARAVERIEAKFGSIDILVNNAGIHRRALLEQMEEAQWREVIDTNLTSAFLVSRAVGTWMMARRAGKIINICSLMSEVSRPSVANYAAAKGGLKMLTKAMAVEWAKHNVQVNAIGPGYFATEMNKTLQEDEAFNAWVCQRTPAGRWGQPEDIVGAAVFLASRASDFVNGHVLYVDGGILAAL